MSPRPRTGKGMRSPTSRRDHPLRQASLSLYISATLLPLLIANAPGWGEGWNRAGVNLLGLAGAASVLVVRFFPWDRFHRNLFLVMSVSSVATVATLVYLTGGEGSPFAAYWFLTVVFCALYYARTVAIGIGLVITLASLSPLLYGEPSRASIAHHLVLGVCYMLSIWAGSAMAGALADQEASNRRLGTNLHEARRLRGALERRTTQLEAVHDVGRELASSESRRAVCETLAGVLHERFGHQLVTVFLPDGGSGGLAPAAQRWSNPPSGTGEAGCARDARAGAVVDHVARTRRTYRTGDASAAPLREDPEDTPARCELAVPLLAGGDLQGVLHVESPEPGALDRAAVVALEAVADHAALALRNARDRERLAEDAATDALTGLPNHRELLRRLDAELERAGRYDRPLSVLFLDLDRFKGVNDTWGHEAGDHVLREFARLARGELREADTLGRYGGEELVAVLPEADDDEALATAERLRRRVAQHRFRVAPDAAVAVTVSAGVATYPGDGDTRRDVLRAADAALYDAKRLGRDRACAARAGAGEEGTPSLLPFVARPPGGANPG